VRCICLSCSRKYSWNSMRTITTGAYYEWVSQRVCSLLTALGPNGFNCIFWGSSLQWLLGVKNFAVIRFLFLRAGTVATVEKKGFWQNTWNIIYDIAVDDLGDYWLDMQSSRAWRSQVQCLTFISPASDLKQLHRLCCTLQTPSFRNTELWNTFMLSTWTPCRQVTAQPSVCIPWTTWIGTLLFMVCLMALSVTQGCTVWNDWLVAKNERKGSGCGLIWGPILPFVYSDWGKSWTSIRISVS
jgi:hypothetical protein